MDDALLRRRTLPPGGEIATWPAADGWPLAVGAWPEGARGTLLFLNGRADFLGKYAEAFWWWRARGWALCAPDWRGQGLSGRLGRTPLHGHVESFEPWLADLATIVARLRDWPRPLVAVGHSMGGHLLLRALAAGQPGITRAALTAPMLGIRMPVPSWLALALARAARLAGQGGRFLPGQGPNPSPAAQAARARALTSCSIRQADESWWLTHHPDRRIFGPTFDWLGKSLSSLKILGRPGVIEAIHQPVLALLAADEQVVDNAAAIRLLARLRHGCYQLLPGRHELLREADVPRLATLGRLDAFLEDTGGAA